MKKLKIMLALGLTLCMFSGQSALAADLPAATENVADVTGGTDAADVQEPAETVDAAEQADVPDGQGGAEDAEEGSGEENKTGEQVAEARKIAVDMDSISISTSIVSAKEDFRISFKLQDDKYIFDGEGSQIFFRTFNGHKTIFAFPIHYDPESGTYTGISSIDGWDAEDAGERTGMTINSILLCAADGDKYEIVNGSSEEYDHDSNTQMMSEFFFEFINAPYPFTDIPAGSWYQGTVDMVNSLGIMTGTKPDTFSPVSILSRAQFATILYRMEKSPQVEYNTAFKDVPKGQFYTDAVIWASKTGIITGYNSETFGPADVITREQMATMMYRYAKYKEYDISGQGDLSSFPDNQNVSGFAKEAMGWANYKGIITGDGGKLNARGNVTRAVCATIISRFIKVYS